MNYIAFDLEISKVVPDGETDWKAYRPLGISCWALAYTGLNGKIETLIGHGTDTMGNPTPQMSRLECRELVNRLLLMTRRGYTLLTHNGASFDLDILAEESGLHAECVELARNSVDTCFLVHCLKGFPVGLEAIAKGMGLSGKLDGMSGALAPALWAEGRYAEVLDYVRQDARCTLEVALAIEAAGGLYWIAKSGRRNWLYIPKLATVAEALALPEPDTSWMTLPIPRRRFVEWMEGELRHA